MILIDYSQIAYATILEHLASTKTAKIDEHTGRILVLDTIRANVNKFKRTYGPEVVIAFDDQHYWRRDKFPHYKHSRKKNRENSQFDWDSIIKTLNTLREEFKAFLPYKVMIVPHCEADDIIATLVMKHYLYEKLLIVSADKDFRQLHVHSNVAQYSPIQKKFITEENSSHALKEQIIRGDAGDGIPNILSPDNSFVDGIRQKPVMEKKLAVWINQEPTDFCTEEMLKNYHRNKALIDLREVPNMFQEQIVSTFEAVKRASKPEFLNYLTSQRLMALVEVVDEF